MEGGGLMRAAARIRRAGAVACLVSLATAAWVDGWTGGFLLGAFLVGLGIGLSEGR